jgi:FHA domain
MAMLNYKTVKRDFPARAHCLLGRHARCDVRVESPRVSGEHALLTWRGHGWELQDLGSRNGTYLGDRRLGVGEHVRLDAGAVFSLSRSAAIFELCDASPPGAAACHQRTGEWSVSSSGILALPNERRPLVTLFTTSANQWLIEIDDQVRPAVDQEQIVVDGETFTLELPAPVLDTQPSEAGCPLLEAVRLRLAVSQDEEQVDVTVLYGGNSRELPSRRYHYLLLTLARIWLADEGVAPSMRGWIDRDELCTKLDMDVNKLNVEIHRARKQLAALGVRGAVGFVERRPGTRELRIGVHDIEVVRL